MIKETIATILLSASISTPLNRNITNTDEYKLIGQDLRYVRQDNVSFSLFGRGDYDGGSINLDVTYTITFDYCFNVGETASDTFYQNAMLRVKDCSINVSDVYIGTYRDGYELYELTPYSGGYDIDLTEQIRAYARYNDNDLTSGWLTFDEIANYTTITYYNNNWVSSDLYIRTLKPGAIDNGYNQNYNSIVYSLNYPHGPHYTGFNDGYIKTYIDSDYYNDFSIYLGNLYNMYVNRFESILNSQYQSGYDNGYDMGIRIGYDNAKWDLEHGNITLGKVNNNVFSLLKEGFQPVTNLLNFKIGSNVTIGMLISVPVAIGILLLVIKVLS
ncbi:MAG: hypothetical protein MJZ37_09975 [Bacilli bacterium]|nr:hypothetical protein [Bacilli bacterium]